MKQIIPIALAALLMATPAAAQEPAEPPQDDLQEGLSLLEQGAKLFLKGLADEIEPAMRELADNLQPVVQELLRLVDDFNSYEMPEMLPNGDIIIRRKPDHPLPSPDGEIEI